MINAGTRWSGADGKSFMVLSITEQEDGHTWVHYRNEQIAPESPNEYSCYLESFLSRFSPLPTDR
jgi:hypothetical protein